MIIEAGIQFANLFCLGLLAHFIADWVFQNEWMSTYKVNLRHPAAWVHFAIHLTCMVIVWPVLGAIVVAVTHALIDTRKPLVWWRKVFRQTSYSLANDAAKNNVAVHVAFWQDQGAHIIVLGIVALMLSI